MVQIVNLLPLTLLVLATGVNATARFSNFYSDDNCKDHGSKGLKMGNTGCFNLGHVLSYTTGNHDEPGQAPEGRWCLIKYQDDTCNCIDDYEVVGLSKGYDSTCHTLEPNPYHGSYHWHKIDVSGTGECPTSGCYNNGTVVRSVPSAEKKGQGHEIVEDDQPSVGYVGAIPKRRLDSE